MEACKQAWGGSEQGWGGVGWVGGGRDGGLVSDEKGYQGTAPNHSIQQCLCKDLDQQLGIVPNCLKSGGVTQWHGICKDLVSNI